MTDTSIKSFNGRIKRIDRARKRGRGFEAEGTLGESYYTRKNRKRRSFIRPLFSIVAIVIAFKACVLASVGPADYLARVESLKGGTTAEQIGAQVMAPDLLTTTLANFLSPLFS